MIKLKDLLLERDQRKDLKKPANDLLKAEKKLHEAEKFLYAAWQGTPKDLEEVRQELRKVSDVLSNVRDKIDIIVGEVNSELNRTPMKPEHRRIHGIGGSHWKSIR